MHINVYNSYLRRLEKSYKVLKFLNFSKKDRADIPCVELTKLILGFIKLRIFPVKMFNALWVTVPYETTICNKIESKYKNFCKGSRYDFNKIIYLIVDECQIIGQIFKCDCQKIRKSLMFFRKS